MSSSVGLLSRFSCFLLVRSEQNKEKLINSTGDVNVAKSEPDQVTAVVWSENGEEGWRGREDLGL